MLTRPRAKWLLWEVTLLHLTFDVAAKGKNGIVGFVQSNAAFMPAADHLAG